MTNAYREDYVRAVYVIGERKGAVRGKELAGYLGVSKNTVSEMLSRLRKEGLVKYENYGPLALTSRGRRLAKDLTAKHRLIELFLTKVLKRDPGDVHEEACLLEHDFSNESLGQMRRLLRNPKTDPHGSRIVW